MARDAGLATKLRRAESRWQELYDETNGSPLALLHTLGLMRVRATLTFDGALEMLRGNRDADLQKFIFQEARKELTENDEIALGALSFFVPSATFEAWMQVAGITRNALETTIDRLSALSLVDVLAGEERYALHPLTRAFVRNELLGDANVVCSGIETRFARYLESRWAEEYRKSIEVAVLVVIRDLASQGQASEERLRGMARRTLALIEPGMSIMKLYQRGVQLDEGYPELGPVVEKIRKGTILAARNVPGTSRTAWLREGDPYTLEFLGNRARSQQEYDLAEIYYREAFAIEQIFNDKGGQAQCQSNLGWLALDRKQYPNAYKCFEQELALAQEIGRQDLIADAQYGLARVHQAEGRADLALLLAQSALKIYERLPRDTPETAPIPAGAERAEDLRAVAAQGFGRGEGVGGEVEGEGVSPHPVPLPLSRERELASNSLSRDPLFVARERVGVRASRGGKAKCSTINRVAGVPRRKFRHAPGNFAVR